MPTTDQALDKARAGAEVVRDKFQELRQENRYVQARVALVVAYVVVVVLTLWLAPPRLQQWVVTIEKVPFGMSFRTNIAIANNGGGDLEGGIVEVSGRAQEFDGTQKPGRWRSAAITLPEGMKTTLSTDQLVDKSGIHPGYALEVREVRVLEDDGDERYVFQTDGAQN